MANSSKTEEKKVSPQSQTVEGLPDFSGWEERQVGFAPYWEPEAGQKFFGQVIDFDDRDEKFHRYLCVAGGPLDCFTGSEEQGTKTAKRVNKGDTFTISVYAQLKEEFELYLSAPFPVPVLVEAKEKIKGGKGHVWLYTVKVAPETNEKLRAFKAKMRTEALKGGEGLVPAGA